MNRLRVCSSFQPINQRSFCLCCGKDSDIKRKAFTESYFRRVTKSAKLYNNLKFWKTKPSKSPFSSVFTSKPALLTSTFMLTNVEVAIFVAFFLFFSSENFSTVFAFELSVLLARLVSFVLVVLLDDAEVCPGGEFRQCFIGFWLKVGLFFWLEFCLFRRELP